MSSESQRAYRQARSAPASRSRVPPGATKPPPDVHNTLPSGARASNAHLPLPPLAAQIPCYQSAAGNHAVTELLAASLGVQRRRRATEPDAPMPEHTAVDVTGLYDPLKLGEIRTLRLNQAGQLITGWYRGQGSVRRVEMTVNSHDETGVTAEYVMYHQENKYRPWRGTANFRKNGPKTTVTLSGAISGALTRVSTTPAASEAAISALPPGAAAFVRTRSRSPLTAVEEGYLLNAVDRTRTAIGQYLKANNRHEKRVEASLVDYAALRVKTGVEAPGQRELARQFYSHSLAIGTHTVGDVSRNDWDWLLVIMARHPSFTRSGRRALGVDLSGVSTEAAHLPVHNFEWRLYGTGAAADVGVGVGAYVVTLQFREVQPDPWSANYTGWMGGLSAGPSIGVTMGFDTGWNRSGSSFPYKAPNLVGWFGVLEAGAKAAGGIGGGASASSITLEGDGTLPALILLPKTWSVSFGIHAGAELGGSRGKLHQGTGPRTVRAAPPPATVAKSAAYGVGSATHFPFDDPSLTDSGRQILRRFLADERASISSPKSRLVIWGHASTVGREKRNEELARLRALNTAQAIRDIAGDALACEIEVDSFGERIAGIVGAITGASSETRDPAWRRTDILLNGRLRVRLTATPP